jgi:putative ABC transport system permease protein
VSFVVRSDRPAEALAAEIKRAVHEVDPTQPVSRLRPADELIADAVARQRFSMVLLAVFGGLALTLAAVGVYGVMAYTVSQRTREMGIRLALGAKASSVLALVLVQGLGMALAGVAIGVLASLALGHLVNSLLYDVSPSDPRVLVLVAVLLSTISLAASLIPAVRATRVDPIEALRSE